MKEIKKQKNKKRKQILRRRIYMMTAGLFVLLAVAFARGHHSAGKEDDLSSKTKEVIQNKTQEEMYTSRLERVKAMAKNQGYPKGVIELLDKNEDTIDFVEDYGEKKDQAVAKDIGVKIQKGTIPELIQWDERWDIQSMEPALLRSAAADRPVCPWLCQGLPVIRRSRRQEQQHTAYVTI